MTGFSRLSRFGMMYKPLTENLGEKLLMLYREDFLAKTLVQREKAQELMENEAGCGDKWRGSFTKYDPSSCSWKTHQCSLLGDLDEFLETWPQWGLMRDGECWEQQTLVQTIKETGYGLSESKWPTPTATQARSEGMILQMRKLVENGTTTLVEAEAMIAGTLTPQRMQKWPTPIASRGGSWRGDGQVSMIARNVETYEEYWLLTQGTSKKKREKYWPTPQLADYKDRGNMSNPSIQKRAEKGKQMTLSMVAHPTSGQLNPMWVEWLMGWPLGWTDLKPLETGKSPSVPQQLGES
jgi:hypothetical protein